ncbi:type III-A CRISPR-associated RAMP protein Csm4 [Thermodesulfovibrio thiophilus]|uniref:type III-A CRISPR-associated RAMP protein Csm4 n=1 Tax=Thermodesulfovibrio thiophilus TaxID=340095 RepID=UPI0017B3B88C|nr:hypothetical protein [Thermodesulfovibrio thiophilus]HHW20436.1 hypothetical protein [Thermodesulfovibrio thiophilus]
MKTFEIIIKPLSGFGTPIKGDTLFGHICWHLVYDDKILGMSLTKLLADYATNPFLVVSSAYPNLDNGYALKRPDLPLDKLFNFSNLEQSDIIKKRKDFKKKIWMHVIKGQHITTSKSDKLYLSDSELFEKLTNFRNSEIQRQLRKTGVKSFILDYTQPHNTINRLTGTTGEGQFAPYFVDYFMYTPDAELVIFVGLREDISIEQLIEVIKKVGETGFGKDASTGFGRFMVIEYKEIDLFSMGSENPNACYTLAPCVPEKNIFTKMFFTPFIRFGRHGDILAKSKNPFKNPVIMADEGAVFIPVGDMPDKPYIGTPIFNISKVEPDAVSQGYSLYIPIKMEDVNE